MGFYQTEDGFRLDFPDTKHDNKWEFLSPIHFLFINVQGPESFSLQNKIWNLPDGSTILPKFIYGKEGKPAGPTPVLTVRVHGPALILKTEF